MLRFSCVAAVASVDGVGGWKTVVWVQYHSPPTRQAVTTATANALGSLFSSSDQFLGIFAWASVAGGVGGRTGADFGRRADDVARRAQQCDRPAAALPAVRSPAPSIQVDP